MVSERRTLVAGGAIGTLLAAAVLALAITLATRAERSEPAVPPAPPAPSARSRGAARGDVGMALAGAALEPRVRALLSRDAGEPLRVQAASRHWDALGFDPHGRESLATSRRLRRHYGVFSLYVARDGRGLDRLVRGRRESRGIRWERELGRTGAKRLGAWTATRRYGRDGLVVLTWQAGGRRSTDARFERLDAVLRRLTPLGPRGP
jgi:hypothetical protein